MRRPIGIDASEVVDIDVDGVGIVQFGYIPSAKFSELRARTLELMTEGEHIRRDNGASEDDDDVTRLPPTVAKRILELQGETTGAYLEIVRWAVRGWKIADIPDAVLEVDSFTRGTRTRECHVLSDESLDVVDAMGWASPIVNAAMTLWTITDTEKKS